jgi:hypothetical protein
MKSTERARNKCHIETLKFEEFPKGTVNKSVGCV